MPPPAVPSDPLVASTVPPLPDDDRTPEIRGRILDADGNAAEGANVRLVSVSPPYDVYREAKSGPSGAFSFPHLDAWQLRVVADHGADGLVTSAVLRTAEHKTIEITLVLSPAGGVRGTVVDGSGNNVAGAVVSVEGVPWTVPAATSDGAGAFRLESVPDEATALVAVARGYRAARAPLGAREEGQDRVVRLVLSPAEPIRGEVRDDDGNPVYARITACEGQPFEARLPTKAEDGTFELPPYTIGCVVVAEHPSYAPSDPAIVMEGVHLQMRVHAGGAIEGAVVDERGAALSPFSLGIESFTPSSGRGFEPNAPINVDDARGEFRWSRLAPGTYVMVAASDGRPPARSSPVDVRGGVTTRGVRIVIAPGGTLIGHVYDDAHVPVAAAELRFDQVSSAVTSKASARTDEHGAYRLQGAPEGPFTLLARKDGYRAKLISGMRMASGETRSVDVVLSSLDGAAGGIELGGIGAALTQSMGTFALGEVYADNPAARAGLRAGDRLLRIDGEPTDGMSMADVLQRLRGEVGSTVGITAERSGSGERIDLTIVRGKIVR